MEKQTLPNSTLVLILGILSILTCCCYGIVGMVLGIIGLVLANKAKKIYLEEPEIYKGYGNLKTGRILSIIGIVLGSIYLIATVILMISYGVEGIQEMQREMIEEYGGGGANF